MYKKVSYWEQNTFLADIDLAIIGSGIVGLSAAIAYKDRFPKRKVVILEAGSLPTGASTKNAGFACFGSITELIADLELYGERRVVDLIKKRWEGLAKLRERVGDVAMDYQEHGGFELLESAVDQKELDHYISFFNDRTAVITGIKNVFSKVNSWNEFGFGKEGFLIKNRAEGQIHPGKMMVQLMKLVQQRGILFLNGYRVQKINDGKNVVHLESNTFEVSARQVLVATNGFTAELFPNLKLSPARNQVILTSPIPDLKFKGCFHYEEGYYYFRNIGNRILLGGARNCALEEETTDRFGYTSIIQNKLSDFLKEIIIPNTEFQIEHIWSGILGVGPTKSPLINKLSERVGIAVRLGGMGIAIGSLVGEEGAALFD